MPVLSLAFHCTPHADCSAPRPVSTMTLWLCSSNSADRLFSLISELQPFPCSGNWDIKTKIVEQCVTSDIEIPPYFKEWINIKDIYLNHYNRNVSLATAQPLKQIGPLMEFKVSVSSFFSFIRAQDASHFELPDGVIR
jgi:hypothetical protein